jgi:hypothetical protein
MPVWPERTVALLVDTAQVLQRERGTLSHRGAAGDSSADATSRKTPAYLVVATRAPSSSRQGVREDANRATPTMMGPNGLSLLWTHFWRPTIFELHPVARPPSHMADRLEHWISKQHPDRESLLGTTPAGHFEAKLFCNGVADFGASSGASKMSHAYSVLRRRTKDCDGCILWMVGQDT